MILVFEVHHVATGADQPLQHPLSYAMTAILCKDFPEVKRYVRPQGITSKKATLPPLIHA